jgi:hypothetical protein
MMPDTEKQEGGVRPSVRRVAEEYQQQFREAEPDLPDLVSLPSIPSGENLEEEERALEQAGCFAEASVLLAEVRVLPETGTSDVPILEERVRRLREILQHKHLWHDDLRRVVHELLQNEQLADAFACDLEDTPATDSVE